MSNAMEKMLADIVLKAIPEQVRQHLTEENLNKIVLKAGEFVQRQTEIYNAVGHLILEQQKTNELLTALMEKQNDDSGSRGKRTAKRVDPPNTVSIRDTE